MTAACICSFSCLMPVWAAEDSSGRSGIEAGSEAGEEAVTEAGAETEDSGKKVILLSGAAARKKAEDVSDQCGGPGAAAAEKDGSQSGPDGQSGKKGESLGMFTVTGYCGCEECSGGHNLTYSGTVPKANHTLSADIGQFPVGTKLMIDDVVYTVEDMGSSLRDNWVDIYFDEHELAEAFGMQTKEVFAVIGQEL